MRYEFQMMKIKKNKIHGKTKKRKILKRKKCNQKH